MDDSRRQELERFKVERTKELEEKKRRLEDLRRRRQERLNQPSNVDDVLNALMSSKQNHEKSTGSGGERKLGIRKLLVNLVRCRSYFSVRNIAEFSIQPKSCESYEKSIQAEEEPSLMDNDKPKTDSAPTGRRMSSVISPEAFAQVGDAHTHDMGVGNDAASIAAEAAEQEELEDILRDLTPEEREEVMGSADFQAFFHRASRMMERLLGQYSGVGFDFAVEYGTSGANDFSQDAEGGQLTALPTELVDASLTLGRPIHDIRASPHYPELFLVAYGAKTNAAPTDPGGLVLLWSLALPHTPEVVLTAPSPVLCATFCRFNPALVLGGTFSGAVCVWDLRTRRSTPVQMSGLSSKGHAHPVYACSIVGSQNAHNLVTVSTDGRLCAWSVTMVANPTESSDIKKGTTTEVSVTAAAFAEGETNAFLVGADDGSLVVSHVHAGGVSTKAGADAAEGFHRAPVTSLDYFRQNPKASVQGEKDTSEGVVLAGAACNDLLVSGAMDWTVRLWSGKGSSAPEQLAAFDCFEDYVADVKFHPFNPAVFVAADCSGKLALFNLAKDVDSPVAFSQVSTQRDDVSGKVRHAVTRLAFTADGRGLIVGDSAGILRLFKTDRDVYQPSQEHQQHFLDALSELRAGINDSQNSKPVVGGTGTGLGASGTHERPSVTA